MNVYTTGPRSSSRAVVMMKRKTDPRKPAYPDYLVHYGIFGQKWGVRRYQNEDGTLTEEGKERYNQKLESENWKKQIFPLDYVSLSHNPDNKELSDRIENDYNKLKEKIRKILNER